VINVPKNLQRVELTNGMRIRQAAIRHGCSLITDVEKAKAFIHAIGRYDDLELERVRPLRTLRGATQRGDRQIPSDDNGHTANLPKNSISCPRVLRPD